jgi:hypothetical protein
MTHRKNIKNMAGIWSFDELQDAWQLATKMHDGYKNKHQ